MFKKPVLCLRHAMRRIMSCKSLLAKRRSVVAIASRVTGQWQTPRLLVRPSRVDDATLRHRPSDHGEQAIQPDPGDVPIEPLTLTCRDYGMKRDECRSGASARYGALPFLTRYILYLSRKEGMNGAQISVHLGLSRRAVRRHLRRAVATLAAP